MIVEQEVASEEIVKVFGEVTEAMIEVLAEISEAMTEGDLGIVSEENLEAVLEAKGGLVEEAVLEAIHHLHPAMIECETISILEIAIFVRNEVRKIVVDKAALEAIMIIMKIVEETEIFANLMMTVVRVEIHTVKITNLVILTIFMGVEAVDEEIVEAIVEAIEEGLIGVAGGTIAEENPEVTPQEKEVTLHREI